ncbi:MAG: hypothetical protein IPL35_11995 [Sphingobacteriales bacterium]|nr:hypothetical protein [Sphingobacteriales bacterium]
MTQLAVQAQYNPNLPRNNSGTANDDVPDDFGDNGKFSWQRVFTGGGLGVQFGNVTNVSLSPLVGYHFTNRFSAGASFAYNYFRDGRSSLVYKYNLWGPGALLVTAFSGSFLCTPKFNNFL